MCLRHLKLTLNLFNPLLTWFCKTAVAANIVTYTVKLMFLERKYAALTLKKKFENWLKNNKVISKNVLKIYFRNFSTVHNTK